MKGLTKGCMAPAVLWLVSIAAHGNVQWGEPDTTLLGQYAKEVQAREHRPDELTLLTQDISIHLGPEEVRKRVREVWFYSDTADAHDYGTDTITFNQHSDTLTVHTAASVDRYGELRAMDPETARVTNVQQNNIFTDSRQAVLSIPGIGAGSVTLLEYELVEDRQALEMPWLETWYPQWFRPLEHFRLSVSWSDGEAPRWSNTSDLVSCREAPGKLTCKGQDLPAAVWEEGMSIADNLDRIVLADPMSWADVVSHARNEFDKAMADVAGARDLLDRLAPNDLPAAEGMTRVHEFVARDVRYVSLSEHGNTITPHTVAEVLHSRYGDCKDKSALLTYLLTQLGYDPYPVLVATDRSDPDKLPLPSMGYFDHMVICLDLVDGTTCMDATDAYTDAGSTPAWIQGRVALPLRPHETPTLIPRDDHRWTLDVTTELTFLPDGGQSEYQVRSYQNAYAGSLRSLLAGQTTGEQHDWAREQYASVVSELAVPAFQFGQVNTLSPELTVSSRVDYPSFLSVDADLDYVENDAWLQAELESVYPTNEHYDGYFAGLRVTSHFDVDLGGVWSLRDMPAELDLQHHYGHLSRTVEKVGNDRFRVTSVLDVPRQEVTPEKQPELRALLELMAREAKLDFTGTLK